MAAVSQAPLMQRRPESHPAHASSCGFHYACAQQGTVGELTDMPLGSPPVPPRACVSSRKQAAILPSPRSGFGSPVRVTRLVFLSAIPAFKDVVFMQDALSKPVTDFICCSADKREKTKCLRSVPLLLEELALLDLLKDTLWVSGTAHALQNFKDNFHGGLSHQSGKQKHSKHRRI